MSTGLQPATSGQLFEKLAPDDARVVTDQKILTADQALDAADHAALISDVAGRGPFFHLNGDGSATTVSLDATGANLVLTTYQSSDRPLPTSPAVPAVPAVPAGAAP